MPILSNDGLTINVERKLQGWGKRNFVTAGVNSLYAFLCAMTLYSVVDSARSGYINAIPQLLALFSSVGANLIANIIQNWRDEAKAASDIEGILRNPETRRRLLPNLDALLIQHEVIEVAGRLLPPNDRKWYLETLQQELTQMGNWNSYSSHLQRAGFSQENRNVYMGDGSQYIEGSNTTYGNFNGPQIKKGGDDE